MSLHAPQAASMHRSKIRRRYFLPLLIALLGIFATTTAWVRARDERVRQMRATFELVAETNRLSISRRIQIYFNAINNLARYWQLFGLQGQDAWRFHTGMVLQSFVAIDRVAWVDREGRSPRYLAQDSTETLDPTFLENAVQHQRSPGAPSVVEVQEGGELQLYFQVRTPEDSVGVLVAEMNPAAVVAGRIPTDSPLLAATVTSSDNRLIYQLGRPAAASPSSIEMKSVIPLPTGSEWTIRYQPTQTYWEAMRSPWPNYFLITGLMLSLALGALAFQFMRLREYSSVLAQANRALDAQVRELQARDHELSRVNQDLESRVARRTYELEDTLRDLETFSHSVSHDLRSPIGAVLNLVAILEEDYGGRIDNEGMRLLGRIRNSAHSAVRLLNELVQLTWAGSSTEERKTIEMTAVARAAFSDAVTSDTDGAKVHFESAELPRALGDPALIERVFTNLFSNALKYTRGQENRTIAVQGREGDGENTYTVSDNGIGFDPEQASRLFEPFRRLHSGGKYEGTGLGLAIAAKIVRRHGGRMWAESDGSNGAAFSFTLPAERSNGNGSVASVVPQEESLT
ncbi:MAG TPA: ATP-binding protein [Candidatus Eisenbacteria bacterium]|nr:ATP-binding protein [Candidatus Eisenbacteria bacterium]